jgi:hypothetical protein
LTTVNPVQDRGGSGGAGLLVSILLRFPEIGSVTFDPSGHSLCLTLLIHKRISPARYDALRLLILESLAAFAYLQGFQPRMAEVNRTAFRGVTAIEITRDAETLSREEIALLIGLARERFGEELVVDPDTDLPEEDMIVQEQLIDEALDHLREVRQQYNLIAYREGGRVLVFNK